MRIKGVVVVEHNEKSVTVAEVASVARVIVPAASITRPDLDRFSTVRDDAKLQVRRALLVAIKVRPLRRAVGHRVLRLAHTTSTIPNHTKPEVVAFRDYRCTRHHRRTHAVHVVPPGVRPLVRFTAAMAKSVP